MFLVENVVVVNLKYVIYQDIAYLYKRSGVFWRCPPPYFNNQPLASPASSSFKNDLWEPGALGR